MHVKSTLIAIAASGVVVSVLTATGMVVAFGGIIKEMAGGNLGMLLLLLCLTVLVLGLGIPTTPSYIIADDVVIGAVGYEQLKGRVDNVRKCGKTNCN